MTLLVGVPVIGLLAACGPTVGGTAVGPVPTFAINSGPPARAVIPYALPATAAQALADLAVMPNVTATAPPMPANAFGTGKSAGSNCDALDTVLQRDLTHVTFVQGSTCKVVSGLLFDPYTGQWAWFSRTASLDQVGLDYVVSLHDAWANGAYGWPARVLTAFANDPLELHATAAGVITQKGNQTAATWLPPDASYRCRYVISQVAVKVKYLLSVTSAERAAMVGVLQSCPASLPSPSPTASPPPAPSLPPKPAHVAPKVVRTKPVKALRTVKKPAPVPVPTLSPHPSPSRHAEFPARASRRRPPRRHRGVSQVRPSTV